MSAFGRRPTDTKVTGPRECDLADASQPVGEERAADRDPSDEPVLDDPLATFTEWESPADEQDYARL